MWWRHPCPLIPRPSSAGPSPWPGGRPAGPRAGGTPPVCRFPSLRRLWPGHDPENRPGLVYYTCSTYRRKSKTACTKHTIREDRLRTPDRPGLRSGGGGPDPGAALCPVEEICVQEGGEIAVHPLQTGEESLT